jgi:hypothetical protein
MGLSSKQQKFIASYQLTLDPKQSALNAGYSANSAHVEGCRLLKNPKIIAELNQWKAKNQLKLDKDSFIDKAMNCFESLELTEANKPRFLELAGKASAILGSDKDSRPNQTLILNVDTKGMSRDDLLSNVRRLLADNSGNA